MPRNHVRINRRNRQSCGGRFALGISRCATSCRHTHSFSLSSLTSIRSRARYAYALPWLGVWHDTQRHRALAATELVRIRPRQPVIQQHVCIRGPFLATDQHDMPLRAAMAAL